MTNLKMFYSDYNKQNQVNQSTTNFKPIAQQPQQQFGANTKFKQLTGKSTFSNQQKYDVGFNNNAKYNFNGKANLGNNNNYGYIINGNNFNGNSNTCPVKHHSPINQLPVIPPQAPPEQVGENMRIKYWGDPHLEASIDKNGDGIFSEDELAGKIDNMERGPQQLLADTGINLVANQVPYSKDTNATVVGSTDLELGDNKFLFNADGSVSLNGKPYTVPADGWSDGKNKIKSNGKSYDVTTPEYKFNIENKDGYQNISAQTGTAGVNSDYTKPVGMFGDVFTNEGIAPLQDVDTNKDGYIKNGEGAKYATMQKPKNTKIPTTQSGSSGENYMNLIMQLLTQLMKMLGMNQNSTNQNQNKQTEQQYFL